MKKKYLFLSMLVTILLGMMISCEALEPDDSNNDSETPTFYNTYDESGLYLGIIGFNDVTIEKEIDLLNSSTIDECKSFIDDFTTEKATLLYYAEEEALNNLKHSKFPEDLTSVSIVTFTDGLDQGSINLRKEDFSTSADFLGALENRIKSDKVVGLENNPQSINAYTIGLRGNDIRNEVEQQRFRDNLEKLSSSEGNMYEASNMDDVNNKFKEIAKSLYNSFNVHSIEFKISSNWEEGLTFRFTFDELINNSAESSTCYLECTIQGDGVSNIKTEGCKYNGEPFVKANSLGVYNYIKFINITDTEGKALDVSKVQQYTANPDNTWQITSEFSNEKDVKPEVEQKTAVVMLVLDCSSSLGDDFPKMQEAAKDFISLLLNASEQKSTITFNANGGNGYMSELIYEKDETKSLFYNTFEREGSIFVGWNTKADGSGDNYSDGQNIQPTEDLTLYAQWEKIQYFIISFDANGGAGSMSTSMTFGKGETKTLTANAFTRTGYTFTGWNTKADGTGTSYSDKQSITPTENLILYAQWEESKGTGTANGHDWVDLGLPSGTKWATTNVGASTPEGYGNYYSWGETTTKSSYNWSTYKWCNGSYDTITKYCVSSSYGTVDNKTTLDLSDDAAYVNWGSSWRMPTKAEQDELRNTNYTTWTWTTRNGVKGYKVTSKTNGNSIFLPAAGYRNDSSLSKAGSNGGYWSSSLDAVNSYYAYVLYLDSSGVGWSYSNRFYGRSVRAVLR
ncbi:MAG: InlB B-repeat-containing protein [Paludibacteraceae bacterium]|nr:InlB B-repeat-containing protein [Paludibacteraceae bacterium]